MRCNGGHWYDKLSVWVSRNRVPRIKLHSIRIQKTHFYSWEEDASVIIYFEEFRRKIQHIILKEKQTALNSDNFATLAAKWEKFTAFYDFFCPDCHITY